jgi:hypothetical protein
MTEYKAHLKSTGPISFGAYINTPKKQGETDREFEEARWRERCNVKVGNGPDKDNIIIPPFAIKNMLDSAAARLSMRTGKGTKTFRAIFETGIRVMNGIVLPFTRETVKGEWRMVPSDGKPAAFSKGSRVPKCFPKVDQWEGVVITVTDDTINAPVLKEHLLEGGQYIGLGSHRIEKRGIYGGFRTHKGRRCRRLRPQMGLTQDNMTRPGENRTRFNSTRRDRTRRDRRTQLDWTRPDLTGQDMI